MIVFRILQAVPGGVLPVVALSMVYRIVPKDKIGSAMGLYGVGVVFAGWLTRVWLRCTLWKVRARWPLGMPGLGWGGDYNPEQWPDELWPRDVELMRRAGLNLVTVGVFRLGAARSSEGWRSPRGTWL